MKPEEVLDLAEHIAERFDRTEADKLRVTLDDHVGRCARGKHIKGWLRSQHKPHKPYLKWLSDLGATCECQFLIKVFPRALKAFKWELAHTCAWCETEIPDDAEVYGISAKARHQADITGWEGSFIPMQLQLREKPVPADSKAKSQGWDFVFAACSLDCARSLRNSLKLEKDVFDAISDF